VALLIAATSAILRVLKTAVDP